MWCSHSPEAALWQLVLLLEFEAMDYIFIFPTTMKTNEKCRKCSLNEYWLLWAKEKLGTWNGDRIIIHILHFIWELVWKMAGNHIIICCTLHVPRIVFYCNDSVCFGALKSSYNWNLIQITSFAKKINKYLVDHKLILHVLHFEIQKNGCCLLCMFMEILS